MNEARDMPIREAARTVATRLIDAGHRAVFAGGCVRDRLLGADPKDFDIATSATPEQILRVFPKARGVGEAFGVMLVRLGGHTFEVATFRKDGPYLDGRRPAHVEFSSEVEDAMRRDFTINGIFEDPVTGEAIDWVGGRDDISAKVIRAIGNPHDRIAEDRLRMLRAVRFAARLGFALEAGTASAIKAHASELKSVSPERVGEEVRRMLLHPTRARAADITEQLGLDGAVFVAPRGDGPRPRLEGLPASCLFATALAAWVLDRLVPIASEGVDGVSSVQLDQVLDGLRNKLVLTNAELDALRATFAARDAVLSDFESLPLARRKRWMAAPGFDPALEIAATDAAPLAERVRAAADRELPSRRLPTPILDGNALLAEGLRPGPEFKVLLDRTLDAQLEGRVTSLEEALRFARSLRGPATA